jgi:hypothetical protein
MAATRGDVLQKAGADRCAEHDGSHLPGGVNQEMHRKFTDPAAHRATPF